MVGLALVHLRIVPTRRNYVHTSGDSCVHGGGHLQSTERGIGASPHELDRGIVVADSGERIRTHSAIVEVGIVVVPEEVVSGHHVLHPGAMQLGNETQPDAQLVGTEVVLHSGFHPCNKRAQLRKHLSVPMSVSRLEAII